MGGGAGLVSMAELRRAGMPERAARELFLRAHLEPTGVRVGRVPLPSPSIYGVRVYGVRVCVLPPVDTPPHSTYGVRVRVLPPRLCVRCGVRRRVCHPFVRGTYDIAWVSPIPYGVGVYRKPPPPPYLPITIMTARVL